MIEPRKRWYMTEPVIVTVVSIGITLAASAGFWLIAITWPAIMYAPYVAGALYIMLMLKVWLRPRIKPPAPRAAQPPDSN